jgi:hypothetical protein
MAKQRAHKAAVAAVQAEKDTQFKAFQQELGLFLDKDGEELARSIPQTAATRRPVVQSPQQCDGRALGKCAAQVDPHHSSLVPIPTLPPFLLTLVPNLLKLAGQDARSTKLLVSPGPSGSPYIEPPPCRSRSSDQVGHLAPGSPPLFTVLDSDFPAMEGAFLVPRNPGLLQVRTKTRAQHGQLHCQVVDLLVLSV